MNDLDTLDTEARQHPILAFLDRIERRPDFIARRRRSYELLGLRAGSRVADIGCGAGTAVLELAANVAPGGSSAGVDANEILVKIGTERAARAGVDVAFYAGSANALPFETASLQGYRAERLYQHLSQPGLAFAEARRVLAHAGRIVLVDQDWDTLVFDSDDTATTRAMVRGFISGIVNGVIGRQYHRLLSDAGFEDVKVYADACTSTSLQILRRGRANTLIVVKLDRLSRSLRDVCSLVEDYFTDECYHLLSVCGMVNTHTAAGRMLMMNLANFNQFEREMISDRTRDALQHMKAQGFRPLASMH